MASEIVDLPSTGTENFEPTLPLATILQLIYTVLVAPSVIGAPLSVAIDQVEKANPMVISNLSTSLYTPNTEVPAVELPDGAVESESEPMSLDDLRNQARKSNCIVQCLPSKDEILKKLRKTLRFRRICGLIVVVAVAVLVLSAKNNPKNFWNARTIISTISLLFILPGLKDFMGDSFRFIIQKPTIGGLDIAKLSMAGFKTNADVYLRLLKENSRVQAIACITMLFLIFIGLIVALIVMSKKTNCPKPPACPAPPNE